MAEDTIKHRPTTWSVEKDHFDLKFENGEPMLDLNATKNGFQFTSITALNRADLANLRDMIDMYLLKTAKQFNIE